MRTRFFHTGCAPIASLHAACAIYNSKYFERLVPETYYTPPGSVLPLGGPDLGYKGFALGLLVEALTSAMGGHGRADEPKQWGASVFLQVMDPAAFGTRDSFIHEVEWLAEACRTNSTKPGEPPAHFWERQPALPQH